MKFLILPTLLSVTLCGETVDKQNLSTLQQLKLKAGELHKQFDVNKDGHVSFEQLGQGIKEGLGFGSTPETAPKINEKYLSHKKQQGAQYLTQEDFEEIFGDFERKGKKIGGKVKAKAQGAKECAKKRMEELKKQAEEAYGKLDKDKDGEVSFQELKQGLKDKIFGDEKDMDEKSLNEYADELYHKYIKSDKDGKSFTKDDFFNIFKQKDDKSLYEKMKAKAEKIYKDLDADSDEKLSFQEIKKGIKQGLGFDKQTIDDAKMQEKVKQLYNKYVKSKGEEAWFNLQDFTTMLQQKWQQSKQYAGEKYQQGKQYAGEKLQQGKQFAGQKLQQGKDLLGDTLEQGKEFVGEKIQQGKEVVEEVVEDWKDGAQTIGEKVGDKAKEIKDAVVETVSGKVDESSEAFKEMKEKASKMYDDLDTDKDNWVTFEELRHHFKEVFGSDKNIDDSDKTFMQCAKDIYKKHSGADWSDQLKLAKQDFIRLVYKWRQQCPAEVSKIELHEKEL